MSNYTSKQEETLRAMAEATGSITYADAVSYAKSQGLKHRSVIAKIKSMKLPYTPKPARVTKNNEPVVLKSAFVDSVQAALGVSLPSLSKVTKQDLATLAQAIGAEIPQPESE